MRYLFRTSCSSPQTATKDYISKHNWNISKRVSAELNYRTPSIFLLITPKEQTTLQPKGNLLMAVNMFVYKKFGQAKRKKVLKKQEIGVATGVRPLLDKEVTNCRVRNLSTLVWRTN
jgi:hypothetical protein